MSEGLAFEGLRVVDLAQGIAAPYCALLLAQNGADVVKIEPRQGDWSRHMGRPYGDQSASSVVLNRGKRSIALDLKKPEAREIAKRLVGRADVVLQNYRPGVIEKLGLDYETVRRENPEVVYLSLTGFGPVGPRASHPATDSVMQASTGFMSINRDQNGTPQRIDYYAIDVITGLYAFQAVSTALYRRAVHGGGRHIRTSLLESALVFQEPKMLEYQLEGAEAEPIGAPVGTFQTSDGHICINARRDPHFQALCRLMQREELIDDPRFRDARSRVAHREALLAIVRECVKTRSSAEWARLLSEADILNGPVADYGDLFEDPQAKAIEAIRWVDHPDIGRIPFGNIAGLPPQASDNPRSRSPHIGEHSIEVLTELDIASAEIDAMEKDGVVFPYRLRDAAD